VKIGCVKNSLHVILWDGFGSRSLLKMSYASGEILLLDLNFKFFPLSALTLYFKVWRLLAGNGSSPNNI
jgi:hypothetical protein